MQTMESPLPRRDDQPAEQLPALARNALGMALKARREAAKLTETQVANALAVGSTYVHEVESGDKVPRPPMLIRFADVLRTQTRPLMILRDAVRAVRQLDKQSNALRCEVRR